MLVEDQHLHLQLPRLLLCPPPSTTSTAAATAVANANTQITSGATSNLTNTIQQSICNPVTATALASAFAQSIVTTTGCNGVVTQAIASKADHCILLASMMYKLSIVKDTAFSFVRCMHACALPWCGSDPVAKHSQG